MRNQLIIDNDALDRAVMSMSGACDRSALGTGSSISTGNCDGAFILICLFANIFEIVP